MWLGRSRQAQYAQHTSVRLIRLPPTLQDSQPDPDPEDGSHLGGENCDVPCFWSVFFLDDSVGPQASWENTAVRFCGAELSQPLLSQQI